MNPKIAHLASELIKARKNKQLSQRDLSARTGLPQAQISKIETGSVNPRLDSLAELARALDLEVMLVPRKFVPAVQAITRGAEDEPPSSDARRANAELKRLEVQLDRAPNRTEEWYRLYRTIRELHNFRLNDRHIDEVRRAVSMLKGLKPEDDKRKVIYELQRDFRNLRNSLAHAFPEPVPSPRPAYSLAEDSDDA
jgi:transcriptional regulator with XRE-family HTH domain